TGLALGAFTQLQVLGAGEWFPFLRTSDEVDVATRWLAILQPAVVEDHLRHHGTRLPGGHVVRLVVVGGSAWPIAPHIVEQMGEFSRAESPQPRDDLMALHTNASAPPNL